MSPSAAENSPGANGSDLPPELVLPILQLAAASSTKFCLALSLVSSWTRHLILPQLLDTVFLRSPRSVHLFHKYITSALVRPPDTHFNPALHVHNLWIAPSINEITPIVQACPNLNHLATTNKAFSLALDHYGDVKHSSPRAPLRLTILLAPGAWGWMSVVGDYHASPTARPPELLTTITHLHITHSDLVHPTAAHLPHLTHIAVRLSVRYSQLRMQIPFFRGAIMRGDVSLKMMVVVVEDPDVVRSRRFLEWLRKRRTSYPEIYVTLHVGEDEGKWVEEIHGGESVWDRAIKETNAILESEGDLE